MDTGSIDVKAAWIIWQALEVYIPFVEQFKDNSDEQMENYKMAVKLRDFYSNEVKEMRG